MLFIAIARENVNLSYILTDEKYEVSVEKNEIECKSYNVHVIDYNARFSHNDLVSANKNLNSRPSSDLVVEYKI